MNYLKLVVILLIVFLGLNNTSCVEGTENKTARLEQQLTEENQTVLLEKQPPPKVSWSMERANLNDRFKLMNERTVFFYMYIFNMGATAPIGYFMVNKVSSVNSQLTNPKQIVYQWDGNGPNLHILPSPAEDGSYGTNGDAVFGFTPNDMYIETNMFYITTTSPIRAFGATNLGTITEEEANKLQRLMENLRQQ